MRCWIWGAASCGCWRCALICRRHGVQSPVRLVPGYVQLLRVHRHTTADGASVSVLSSALQARCRWDSQCLVHSVRGESEVADMLPAGDGPAPRLCMLPAGSWTASSIPSSRCGRCAMGRKCPDPRM